jgi:hypothetical protein
MSLKKMMKTCCYYCWLTLLSLRNFQMIQTLTLKRLIWNQKNFLMK